MFLSTPPTNTQEPLAAQWASFSWWKFSSSALSTGQAGQVQSWACRGEVQPILEHRVPVPSVLMGLRRSRNRGELKDKKLQQVLGAFDLQNCVSHLKRKLTLERNALISSHFFYCLEVQTKRTCQGTVCITDNLILYNT